jgi:hypothetical protein
MKMILQKGMHGQNFEKYDYYDFERLRFIKYLLKKNEKGGLGYDELLLSYYEWQIKNDYINGGMMQSENQILHQLK